MLLFSISIIAGFAVLVWAADRLVVGAAATARALDTSPLFIGLTVVGIGTSAPEMLVSAIASWQGNPGLGIGNALGSNIANVGLVLGVAALVRPLTLRSNTLKREFPVLFGLMAVSLLVMMDGNLSRFDGALLCLGAIPLTWWMVYVGKHATDDPVVAEYAAHLPPPMPLVRALTWLGIGLVLLLISTRVVVWGAVGMAETLGVSDTVIGLSIIAVGTSLPELAASVTGVLKGEHDIAVGNVLGSNMFNLLVVLGLPGLLAPGAFEPHVLFRDFPVMIGLAVFLVAAAYAHGAPRVGRFAGSVLLVGFCTYLVVLYY